jgi:hypothetical protein
MFCLHILIFFFIIFHESIEFFFKKIKRKFRRLDHEMLDLELFYELIRLESIRNRNIWNMMYAREYTSMETHSRNRIKKW